MPLDTKWVIGYFPSKVRKVVVRTQLDPQSLHLYTPPRGFDNLHGTLHMLFQ